MAILPFPLGAINTLLSLLLMHGISVTMFRSLLNQTLPSMEASNKGDKYQITLSKPSAKISNFKPKDIDFQQQLNLNNNLIMNIKNTSLPINSQGTYSIGPQQISNLNLKNQIRQVNQPINSLKSLNSNAAPSKIFEHISQIGQKPFSGTISLYNHGNQFNDNKQNERGSSSLTLTNNNQEINSQPQHISMMNLPFIAPDLSQNEPKIVHVHHHNVPLSSFNPNSLINLHNSISKLKNIDSETYQNIGTFEPPIRSSSFLYQSMLNKREGNLNEPVIKEISLYKIKKYLERKKKKEMDTKKVKSIRIVCSYVFDEFIEESLDPNLIDDLFFCTHLNIHSLAIKSDYQVGLENQYRQTNKLNELMKIKNRNKNLKFILSIGEQVDARVYDAICLNDQLINKFINSIVTHIKLYEFDGINFNFKFDTVDSKLNILFKQNLVQLLQKLKDELNRIGKPSFILSAILSNSPDMLKLYDLKEFNSLFDFVNVIGYEFYDYKKEKSQTNNLSDLYSSNEENLEWIIKNWLNTDLDRNKINVGLPTFGRIYNVAYNNIHSLNVPLVGLGINNGTVSYGEICRLLLKNDTSFIYNQKNQIPFAYNGYDLIAFENEKSLSIKSKYISKLKISGVMLFSLNFDDVYGDCDRSDSQLNRFPLHKVVYRTMEYTSLITNSLNN